MPKKIRVYELARELGLTNKEALDLCLSLGIGVKSHSSSIEDAQADRVRRKADAEGLRRAVQPEDPVDEKAAKATKAPADAEGTPTSRPAPAAPAPAAPPARLERSGLITSRPASEVTVPPSPAAPRPMTRSVPASAAPAPAPPAPPRIPAAPAAAPPAADSRGPDPRRPVDTPSTTTDATAGRVPSPHQRLGQVHPAAPRPPAFEFRAPHPPATGPAGARGSTPRRPPRCGRTPGIGRATDDRRTSGPFRRRRIRWPTRRRSRWRRRIRWPTRWRSSSSGTARRPGRSWPSTAATSASAPSQPRGARADAGDHLHAVQRPCS